VTTPDAVPLAPQNSDSWQFGVTIPAWLVGIDGNTTIRGNQRDVHKSFNDLKQNLDQTFSLGLEAHKGKWGFYGGVGYMKFSNDGLGTLGVPASRELKFVIADAGVSYNLVKTEGETPFILDGTLGLRYWYTDLSLKSSAGSQCQSKLGGSGDWPARQQISHPKTAFGFRGRHRRVRHFGQPGGT